MERLKHYCTDIRFIDGLQTFIISPSKHDDILKDNELLKALKLTEKKLVPFIQTVQEAGPDKIYLAFVYLSIRAEKNEWIPVHCYRNGEQFYHVHYRNSWMCRECGSYLNKSIVMPMTETESAIYHWTERKYPDIPSIFQKIKCPVCGKLLQNYLILLK